MNVELLTEGNDLNVEEGQIGKAMQSAIFPGIAQCFAIAGRRQSFMICTHVTPGSSAQDITDTFELMRELGGTWVSSWHVVGPFSEHFNTSTAQWTSVQDIRDTFSTAFSGASADHWILDVTTQRNRQVLEPGFTIPTKTNYLDIKAERDATGSGIRFSYKGDRGAYRNKWHSLFSGSFSRF